MKTNGARFLESLGIEFELREYEVDPNDFSDLTVAKKIAMPPEQVFKTLLTTGVPSDAQRAPTSSLGWSTCGPNTYVFAVIPGDAELDFKKLARAAGLRKAEMAPLKDVQPLTGYIRGGVTVFGAKKTYPVFVDETAILFDRISVSAGTRGTQLILTPADYLRAASALEVEVQTADLTKAVIPNTAGAPSLRHLSGARVGDHEAGAPGLDSETWESTNASKEGQGLDSETWESTNASKEGQNK